MTYKMGQVSQDLSFLNNATSKKLASTVNVILKDIFNLTSELEVLLSVPGALIDSKSMYNVLENLQDKTIYFSTIIKVVTEKVKNKSLDKDFMSEIDLMGKYKDIQRLFARYVMQFQVKLSSAVLLTKASVDQQFLDAKSGIRYERDGEYKNLLKIGIRIPDSKLNMNNN